MKHSFSLLELIFIITITSIILIVAIPKLFYNIDNANIIKLNSDVSLIRNEINKFKNKQILLNSNEILTTLDNIILNLDTTHKAGSWSKTTNNIYNAWINNTLSVQFIYDINNMSFNCDESINDYCKELTQ